MIPRTSFKHEVVANRRLSEWWAADALSRVPGAWRERVGALYGAKLAKLPEALRQGVAPQNSADFWLAGVVEDTKALRVPVGLSDSELIEKANECAKAAFSLAEFLPGRFLTVEQLRARLEAFVKTYGIKPPRPAPHCEDRAAIARMTHPQWWRRALRVSQARELERLGIGLGYVHKNKEIYATDATVKRRTEQRRRNALSLENTLAKNLDTGQEYQLSELAALSVANPRIRRGELMTRINGFESVAKGLGHIAEFVTLTCPSRFHAMRKVGGKVVRNAKHDGSTPKDAQSYLVKIWSRMRAKFARMDLPVYGFRIAEPHHDATPHWHLLLFMPAWVRSGASWRGRFRAVFRRYALRDSGDETGAKKHRCTFEAIDWSRGTAAGYVAKYVSKNIDGGGYQVQGDVEGGSMAEITPSHRVEAWASTWGVRQFQQIGGAPVGVWRELRRMDEQRGATVLEQARSAADVGNWARYIEVMGGATLPRKLMPLRVAYDQPERLNVYGEQAAPVVVGVTWRQVEVIRDGLCEYPAAVSGEAYSRRYRWEIKRGAGVGVGVSGARVSPPRTCVNNCTRTNSVRDEQSPLFWQKTAFKGFEKPPETPPERLTRESWEKIRGNDGKDATAH